LYEFILESEVHMVRVNQVVKALTAAAFASAMFAGCQSMQWGDSKTEAKPTTKPAAAAPAKPAPAAPAPVAAAPARPTPTPAAPAQATASKIIRIKCGQSTDYKDKAGNVWMADKYFDGGETVDRDASLVVAGTQDSPMYQNERYSMDGYTIPVPNGTYKVNLYFAETYDGIGGPGDRVFSFSVQGKEHKDFDIWKVAGGNNKVIVITENVNVTNGKVEIKFTANAQNPCVNAIEVIPS
jgi:hypothetical protein